MRTLLAVVFLLAFPAASLASDASLERTWDRYLTKTKRLDFSNANVGSNDLKQFSGALRRVGRLVADTRRALAKDDGSTPAGDAARKAGLISLKLAAPVIRRFRQILPQLGEAVELAEAGREQEALAIFHRIRKPLKRLLRSANRVSKLERRTTRLFKRVE